MSLERRQELVQVAREHDACIITDDVYDMLRWPKDKNATQPSSVIPRLVDIDRTLDSGAERKGSDGFGNAVSTRPLPRPETRVLTLESF